MAFKSGIINLSLVRNFFLSFTSLVLIPAEYIWIFLAIITPFLSTISLLSVNKSLEDFTTEIFEMAGKLASDVLLPINRIGDIEGCRLENDTVITPKGFTNAFKKLREDGWTSVDCEKEFGGQGLPTSISILLGEIFSSCNISLTIYQALTHGAYGAILKYGTETQKIYICLN